MGEAKRRGTFEERQEAAILKNSIIEKQNREKKLEIKREEIEKLYSMTEEEKIKYFENNKRLVELLGLIPTSTLSQNPIK